MFNVNLPNGAKVDVTKLSSEWQDQFLSTMVIATDGQVYGSGRNQYGKLGSGSLGASAGDFQQCTTVKYQLPAGVTAVDMSTRDEYTTYVLGSDGKVYAAGYNINGQVGDGTTIDRATPVEVQIPRTSYSY
jgi:alpha-tubulin suppressor-like RCC1 family protein